MDISIKNPESNEQSDAAVRVQTDSTGDAYTCAACGDDFTAKRHTARFCSGACRAAYHRDRAAMGSAGTVSGARPVKAGGWSVTVRFDHDPGIRPGDRVTLSK